MKYDVVIIGGGIIGLSTAYQTIKENPSLKIAVIEKESDIASHQTGNNSGVIHSGIYYKPGSLKAKNCKEGYDKLLKFCDDYGVQYDICGKIIISTKESEKKAFENIFERGVANGLNGIRRISKEEVKEIEPHVHCIEALWVPQTGIIDYKVVANKFLQLFIEKGGSLHLNTKVTNISITSSENIIQTTAGDFTAKVIVNCGGLYSDKLTQMSLPEMKNLMIIPFRGEYYQLKKNKEYLVNNLIYPVPNPDFPFLGVHFTRMIQGGIEAGPNAVLAFRREGYKRWDIDFKEFYEIITFPGFKKIVQKYWEEGWMEIKRSFIKALFVKAMQEMIPAINKEDVYRSGAGVRAQACDNEGGLLDDFKIIETKCLINVCNAPSPAATSSFAIGEHISRLIINKLALVNDTYSC